MPNETAINRSIQIYILSNLAHNKVDVVNASKINRPPIVGVHVLKIIWVLGPSFLIG